MRNEGELQESPYPSSIYDSLASQARAKNFTILHIVPLSTLAKYFSQSNTIILNFYLHKFLYHEHEWP
jgi:hypothetical protein